MDQLVLSHDERKAIDFAGDRYRCGHELFTLLWAKCEQQPDDADWDSPVNILFMIPPDIATVIVQLLIEEDYGAALYAMEFRSKLMNFVTQVENE